MRRLEKASCKERTKEILGGPMRISSTLWGNWTHCLNQYDAMKLIESPPSARDAQNNVCGVAL